MMWNVLLFIQMSPMVPAKRSESDIQDALSDDEMAPMDEEILVDVPYQYEDVEMVECEVMKEHVVESEIPQVRASYKYDGQGIEVKKGEVCISDTMGRIIQMDVFVIMWLLFVLSIIKIKI